MASEQTEALNWNKLMKFDEVPCDVGVSNPYTIIQASTQGNFVKLDQLVPVQGLGVLICPGAHLHTSVRSCAAEQVNTSRP